MGRLQFIHRDGVLKNFSREQAIEYIKNLTKRELAVNLGESLIGEPLVVTYLDENSNKQVLLCVGVSGETGEGVFEPYHIIDSAKINEDILALSGFSQTLREELEAEIQRAINVENNLQTELDTTQTGAGLKNDGTYQKNVDTTYINNVTSLNDADVKLDTELARVEKARKDVTGQNTDVYVPNQSLVSRPLKYINNATSLNDADIKLDQGIQTLNDESIKNVIVNNVTGNVVNNVATVNISGNSIPIGEYEHYDGRVVNPHPIHNEYSLLDSVKQLDVNFVDFKEKEIAERKGIHLVKVTTGLETNIKEAYDLVDKNGNQISGSARVLIYKDSSLFKAYLGHVDDELESYTGTTIIPGTGDTALCFIYENTSGLYELVKINIEKFLEESEFLDGLRVENHKVYVKIDDLSEGFLTVSPEGIKLSGVQSAISTKVTEEKERAEEVENVLKNKLDNVQVGAGLNEDGTYKQHNTAPDDLANYIFSASSLTNADFILDKQLFILSGTVKDFSASTINEINAERERAISAENSISATIVENEYVVSQALNDLNTRVDNEVNRATVAEQTISNNLTTLSGTVESLSANTHTKLENEITRATEKDNSLQNELDKTQVGAGLNEDGTYKHDFSSHYILTASSLYEADDMLDTAIFNLSNTVQTLSGDTDTKINNEVNRATAAEQTISNNLTTLSGTVESLSANTHTKLENEITRAISAEQSINENVTTLSSSTVNNINTLSGAIVNEITRATEVEEQLDDKIKSATVFSQDKTVNVVSSEIGTNISVNIDGVTIAKDNNGTLSTKLSIKKLATPSSTNIREEYVLVDNNDVRHGDSIKVYNDSSLQNVELVTIDNKEYLRFTYVLSDGTVRVVDIDVSSFISETEFKDGLRVSGNNVYVLIDPSSESFLSVSSNGVKLSGVQTAINSAVSIEENRAKTVENAITSNIGTLSSSTVNNINTLSGAVINEITRATTAENNIISSVTTLTANVNASANTLNNVINDEITRATDAEQTIRNSVTILEHNATTSAITLNNTITSSTQSLSNAISSETTRATTSENSLQTQITNEIASRDAAVTAERERAIAAENLIATTYNNAIVEERTNRIEGDNRLERMISGITAGTEERFVEIETNLANEIERAISAETIISATVVENEFVISQALNNLNTRVDNEVNRATAAEQTISNNLTTLSGTVESLSANTVSAITIEATRATNAENSINSNINTFSSATVSAIEEINQKIENMSAKTISGKDAIVITSSGSNNEINLKIDTNDKVLSQNTSGLHTTLTLAIGNDESGTTFLYLKGKDGATITSVDASNFVKDGMINSVSFNPTTKILTFVFNTDAEKQNIDVSLEDLIDVYTVESGSTNYLTINDYKIGAKVNVTDGLADYNTLSQFIIDANTSADTFNTNLLTLSGSVINNKLVITEALNQLNTRVLTLENENSALTQEINTLSGQVGSLTTRVEILENAIANLNIYDKLLQVLSGTTNEISVIGNGEKVIVGFDNLTIVGKDDDGNWQ